jgi:hypothetical protein
MSQAGWYGLSKIIVGILLGLAAAVLQGWAVFLWQQFPGPFLSLTGFKCVVVPLFIEGVVGVVTLIKINELYLHASTNPRGPLSRALLGSNGQRAEPPPTREAWKGGFEPMDDVSDKMSKDR